MRHTQEPCVRTYAAVAGFLLLHGSLVFPLLPALSSFVLQSAVVAENIEQSLQRDPYHHTKQCGDPWGSKEVRQALHASLLTARPIRLLEA
jgi:hypothetical protein